MLSSIKQRMNRDEEEGFTLIELMVVLLIIAILLAIAIPTFLGARNTANARSTQENLRNALTAEQTNWTSNQTFGNSLSTLEPSLSWTTAAITSEGGSAVTVGLYAETSATSSTTGAPAAATSPWSGTYDGTAIVGYAKDNHCYGIFQSNNAAIDFTAYAEWTPSSSSSGCSAPANAPASVATGSAANNISSTAGTISGWYASF